jgi:hypothetical protein
MQAVVLSNSGGFAPVAPMPFTTQLTLPFLGTGCCLTEVSVFSYNYSGFKFNLCISSS